MIIPACIRLAKIIALIGFALPWFTVSCARQPLMTAHGYQLAMGIEVPPSQDLIETRNQMQGAVQRPAGSSLVIPVAAQTPSSPKGWKPPAVVQAMALGSALAILGGLVVGFAVRGRVFASVSAGLGFLGAGLAYATVAGVDTELKRQIAEEAANADNPLASVGVSQFVVRFEPGVWVTVGAAGLAALLAVFLLLVALEREQKPTVDTTSPNA